MKRVDPIRHLRDRGCQVLREGGKHSWWWNPAQNRRSDVPRHREISDILARKICNDLGIDPPPRTSRFAPIVMSFCHSDRIVK